jgi:hypothetical protein
MPMTIEHIDKIARDKQRDVLFITFDKKVYPSYEYEEYEARQNLIKWFEENDIPYKLCGHYASECGWESYRGQLYIDVPMDEDNPKFQLLNNHLEYEDGTMKIKGVLYMYLSLEIAMKNAHHDEPGFWDKWAEDF